MIQIGTVINTHGLKGELKVKSDSDFDDERYEIGNHLYMQYEDEMVELEVATYRKHNGNVLVSFKDNQDINMVEKYKGCALFVKDSDRKPLDNGMYYSSDLMECEVINEEGKKIGKVIDLEDTVGAQKNMRVLTEDKKEILIPFVEVFIKNVDLENHIITIHEMEGLL